MATITCAWCGKDITNEQFYLSKYGEVCMECHRKPRVFSFSWILKETENHKVDYIDFYSENGHDIVLLGVRNKVGDDDWEQRYEVGNPLLGGIKHYSSYNTAEKYFFEMVGRVHRDAEVRKAKGETIE